MTTTRKRHVQEGALQAWGGQEAIRTAVLPPAFFQNLLLLGILKCTIVCVVH